MTFQLTLILNQFRFLTNFVIETLLIKLRAFKARKFERVPLKGNSHSIVTRGFRVSRAPPCHTLRGGFSAFLNFHGLKINTLNQI